MTKTRSWNFGCSCASLEVPFSFLFPCRSSSALRLNGIQLDDDWYLRVNHRSPILLMSGESIGDLIWTPTISVSDDLSLKGVTEQNYLFDSPFDNDARFCFLCKLKYRDTASIDAQSQRYRSRNPSAPRGGEILLRLDPVATRLSIKWQCRRRLDMATFRGLSEQDLMQIRQSRVPLYTGMQISAFASLYRKRVESEQRLERAQWGRKSSVPGKGSPLIAGLPGTLGHIVLGYTRPPVGASALCEDFQNEACPLSQTMSLLT
ncbi:unnamed protein product [Periconia digitata]|uniref:Uncharacterized protein n=1 Tax=Periconia digitata TaxID=1303443 RepID=A0A9W4UIY0_9PLEO|nr:unnamed protein product [Periconia digitata]